MKWDSPPISVAMQMKFVPLTRAYHESPGSFEWQLRIWQIADQFKCLSLNLTSLHNLTLLMTPSFLNTLFPGILLSNSQFLSLNLNAPFCSSKVAPPSASPCFGFMATFTLFSPLLSRDIFHRYLIQSDIYHIYMTCSYVLSVHLFWCFFLYSFPNFIAKPIITSTWTCIKLTSANIYKYIYIWKKYNIFDHKNIKANYGSKIS